VRLDPRPALDARSCRARGPGTALTQRQQRHSCAQVNARHRAAQRWLTCTAGFRSSHTRRGPMPPPVELGMASGAVIMRRVMAYKIRRLFGHHSVAGLLESS
jgi:hypothetical protein